MRRRGIVSIVALLGALAAGLTGSPVRGGDVAAVPASRMRIEPLGLSIPSNHVAGKIPVVLIGGLWIGPNSWAPLVDAMSADPEVSARYEFWTFGYSTGNPLHDSNRVLRAALDDARRRLDPDRRDASLDQMVIVGHSMGGLLARLLIVDSGDHFWKLACASAPDRIVGEPDDVDLARRTLIFEARSDVRTVIFMATPHQGGTPQQWLMHDVATRFVQKPESLLKTYRRLIAANPPDFFTPAFRAASLATSIDEMRNESPMLRELNALQPPTTVVMHSIIPILNGPPGPGGSDGVINYASAHLEGTASEVVIADSHFCQASPRAFAEIRRILLEPSSRP